jgi:hypothetical protein
LPTGSTCSYQVAVSEKEQCTVSFTQGFKYIFGSSNRSGTKYEKIAD